MGRLMVCGVVLLLLSWTPAHAILITFEEGVGLDMTEINTQYEGITFQSATAGIPWYYSDVTTDTYNASSWPSGTSWGSGEYWINDLACAWTTASGDDGKIAFDNQDATYVQVNYSVIDTFYIEAYDANDNLIDSDSGPANLRYIDSNPNGPGTVRVDAGPNQTIAYVLAHDTGNYWIMDNVDTDATGIIPPPVVTEPSIVTIWSVLAALGLTVGWWRRRQQK